MLNQHKENSFQQRNTISKNLYNNTHAINYKISLKFKGYILISLIQKQKKKQIQYLKEIFFQWYTNRSSQPYKRVLFRMLTKKMSSLAFFYRIKSYAQKSLSQSSFKKNNQNQISQYKLMQKNASIKYSNIDIGNENLAHMSTTYERINQKSSNNYIIQQKKCVFVEQIMNKHHSSENSSLQNLSSSELSQNQINDSEEKYQEKEQLVSLQIINLNKKQQNKQKKTDKINYFHKNKKHQKNHLTQYFQSLKNIFSIKLEKNGKQELKDKRGYKTKQIKTQGQQQFVSQLNTSQISSFQGSKKSISFCPSFGSSFKSKYQTKQDKTSLQNKKLIQKGFQIGIKVGFTLLKSVISSIFSKQKHFFITNLLKFNIKTSQQKYKLKISESSSNNIQIQSNSTISLLNQDQYDQRMDLIKRNLQLLEIEQQKQKEIFILCEELQVHHEELLQIQEQFSKIQMNLKHNFFVHLDRIFKKIKKQVFVQIRLHNQKLTAFSTLKQLLQDSDPFDQFPRNVNNYQSDQSLDTRNELNSLQSQNADITSIKVGLKMSQNHQKLGSYIQGTTNRQIEKCNIHLNHLKRPSININIVGTQRQLHRVYTISSMNSSQSSLSLSQNEYSSKLLFQESIKQLNQIQEMNNESQLFSNNSKLSEIE